MGRKSKLYQEKKSKMAVIQAADDLLIETLRVAARDKLIPKKCRWMMAKEIADVVNDFHRHINYANEIKVTTQAEYLDRHRHQTLARAALETLDIKVTMAKDVFSINVDALGHWADLWNREHDLLLNWISKDERRFAEYIR